MLSEAAEKVVDGDFSVVFPPDRGQFPEYPLPLLLPDVKPNEAWNRKA